MTHGLHRLDHYLHNVTNEQRYLYARTERHLRTAKSTLTRTFWYYSAIYGTICLASFSQLVGVRVMFRKVMTGALRSRRPPRCSPHPPCKAARASRHKPTLRARCCAAEPEAWPHSLSGRGGRRAGDCVAVLRESRPDKWVLSGGASTVLTNAERPE